MRDTIRAANATGAELLLADLELAFTMLEHGRTSSDPAACRRNIGNARTASETVAAFLEKLTLEHEMRERIETRLAELQQRLRDLESKSS